MNVKQMAENIYRCDTPVPGLNSSFVSYFIRDTKGVVIEPGPSAVVPQLLQAMESIGMKDLSFIIPTHIHVDHAGGIGALAKAFPQARVLVHPSGAKHAIDPTRLVESTRQVWGDDFAKRFGPIDPVPEASLLLPQDGDVISTGDRELQIIYTPGHAQHHMAILDRKTQGLFSGESLGLPRQGRNPNPLPAVAPPSFDQEVYLETIEKLRKLKPKMIFYSHDGIGRDPERLIDTVVENTKAFGEIIQKALNEGEDQEGIARRLSCYVADKYGPEAEIVSPGMLITGYIMYFKKKGLAR